MTHPPPLPNSAISGERRLRWSFATLLLMLVLSALDQTVVSTALPSIVRDLRGATWLSWVFSAYLIASTVAVPLYGRLADLHGSKPVLLAAVVLFVLGSAACGVATSMVGLIVARGLQGVGGGGLLTLAMTAVARLFPDERRARLQGLLGASYGLSTMAGPLVGGYIVEHTSWRWAFLINLPLGLLALVVMVRQFPNPPPMQRGRLDVWGALLLGAALVSVLLSTREVGNLGTPAWALAFVGAMLAVAFVVVQARAPHPLLPLPLFSHRGVVAAVLLSAGTGISLFAAVMFLPLYFQNARGLSPAASGWHVMPLLAGITLASIASGRLLSARGQVRRVAVAGCMLASLSFLLLGALVRDDAAPLVLVSACLFPLGMGIGVLFPLVTVVAQASVPMPLLGIATASPVMFRSLAGAVGVSVLGALFAAGLTSRSTGLLATGGHFGPALSLVLFAAAALALLSSVAAGGMPRVLRRSSPASVPNAASATGRQALPI